SGDGLTTETKAAMAAKLVELDHNIKARACELLVQLVETMVGDNRPRDWVQRELCEIMEPGMSREFTSWVADDRASAERDRRDSRESRRSADRRDRHSRRDSRDRRDKDRKDRRERRDSHVARDDKDRRERRDSRDKDRTDRTDRADRSSKSDRHDKHESRDNSTREKDNRLLDTSPSPARSSAAERIHSRRHSVSRSPQRHRSTSRSPQRHQQSRDGRPGGHDHQYQRPQTQQEQMHDDRRRPDAHSVSQGQAFEQHQRHMERRPERDLPARDFGRNGTSPGTRNGHREHSGSRSRSSSRSPILSRTRRRSPDYGRDAQRDHFHSKNAKPSPVLAAERVIERYRSPERERPSKHGGAQDIRGSQSERARAFRDVKDVASGHQPRRISDSLPAHSDRRVSDAASEERRADRQSRTEAASPERSRTEPTAPASTPKASPAARKLAAVQSSLDQADSLGTSIIAPAFRSDKDDGRLPTERISSRLGPTLHDSHVSESSTPDRFRRRSSSSSEDDSDDDRRRSQNRRSMDDGAGQDNHRDSDAAYTIDVAPTLQTPTLASGRPEGLCTRGAMCTFWHPIEPCPNLSTCTSGNADMAAMKQLAKASLLAAASASSAKHATTSATPVKPGVCKFGEKCLRPDCRLAHPTQASKSGWRASVVCRHHPNCLNPACRFYHPPAPVVASAGGAFMPPENRGAKPCWKGVLCRVPGCMFAHVRAAASANGHGRNMSLKITHPATASAPAAASAAARHISERSFAIVDGDTERVVPGSALAEPPASS
ncbi:hypothetical protein BC831DRAFT_454783, partial [Entophlyctis helioformis]